MMVTKLEELKAAAYAAYTDADAADAAYAAYAASHAADYNYQRSASASSKHERNHQGTTRTI